MIQKSTHDFEHLLHSTKPKQNHADPKSAQLVYNQQVPTSLLSTILLLSTLLMSLTALGNSLCPLRKLWQISQEVEPSPTQLDNNLLQRWVNSHHGAYAKGAEWVASKIRRIDQTKLEANLERSFREFLTANPNVPILFYVLKENDTRKSNEWLTGFIKERFPSTRDSQVVFVGDTFRLRKFHSENPLGKVLIVDDAAFSGTQINAVVRTALNQVPAENIDLVLGYTTTQAKKEMARLGPHLYHSDIILSLREMLQKEPAIKRDEIDAFFQGVIDAKIYVNYGLLFDFPLTIFEHKLPDGSSFPDFLVEGVVMGTGTRFTSKKVPFITEGKPPYKKVDSDF